MIDEFVLFAKSFSCRRSELWQLFRDARDRNESIYHRPTRAVWKLEFDSVRSYAPNMVGADSEWA